MPGWGVELPAERVLAEIAALGIRATEFGPLGYHGAEPAAVVALLERHGLELVGGFFPVVLHDAASLDASLELARRTADLYAACGGAVLVSAPVLDEAWSRPRPLSDGEWGCLLGGLGRLDEVAADAGLRNVVHPHAGTLVESGDDVRRVLDGSNSSLCLDTGHLAIGGADPVALAREVPERIGHVHLKDIRLEVARRLRAGETTLVDAVRDGLFQPLGAGDVPVADAVVALERAGYEGWYVLEQDVALDAEPPAGEGPVDDVRRSIDFLSNLLGREVRRA